LQCRSITALCFVPLHDSSFIAVEHDIENEEAAYAAERDEENHDDEDSSRLLQIRRCYIIHIYSSRVALNASVLPLAANTCWGEITRTTTLSISSRPARSSDLDLSTVISDFRKLASASERLSPPLASVSLASSDTPRMDGARPEKRRRLDRTSAACDLCKTRKVKCDGAQPCSYCKRKDQSDSCTFSGPKPRGAKSTTNTPANRDGDTNDTLPQARERRYTDPEPTLRPETHADNSGPSLSPTLSRGDHRDTAVPLEARLLRDAQGKVIFIGDCAPISFLQTVRHLIATEDDAFPGQASRDSFIEAAQPMSSGESERAVPTVHPNDVDTLLGQYRVATSGLVDLFERNGLADDTKKWAAGLAARSTEATPAVNYLVLAIGLQESNETKAEAWFSHAKDTLVANLTSSMHLATVQGFALVAVYLLRASQPNGAYLYFCTPVSSLLLPF